MADTGEDARFAEDFFADLSADRGWAAALDRDLRWSASGRDRPSPKCFADALQQFRRTPGADRLVAMAAPAQCGGRGRAARRATGCGSSIVSTGLMG